MLAQLTTVKSRLGITDSTDDTLLTGLIQQASAVFDQYCNRTLARAVGATHQFRGDETEISLKSYPIETATSFHLKTREADGWQLLEDVDYVVRNDCVLSLDAPLGSSRDQGRVTYTGGYVLPGTSPGSGQTALPKDVENACVEQACAWYRARNRGGISSVSGAGTSITQDAGLSLLELVKGTLNFYRRLQL
jgi:hypothetical protein